MKLHSGAKDGRQATPADSPDLRRLTAAGGTTVVVGHDGHPAGDRALATALDLATRLDVPLHVVHSVTLEDFGVDPDTELFESERDRKITAERERISGALAGASVSWTYHEERGEPASCLARLADDLDAMFIVVGASHHGLLRHAMSGAVSKHLLHDQRRPVVVVPT